MLYCSYTNQLKKQLQHLQFACKFQTYAQMIKCCAAHILINSIYKKQLQHLHICMQISNLCTNDQMLCCSYANRLKKQLQQWYLPPSNEQFSSVSLGSLEVEEFFQVAVVAYVS